MSNTGEFYDHTTFPVTRSTGTSSGMRAELDLIETGFNKLPPMTGNALRLVKVGSAATDLTVAGIYEDTGNRVLIGTSASRSVGGAARQFQLEGLSGVAGMSIIRNSNDASAASISLGKSRGTTVGSSTIVQNGDEIGQIGFIAADGTDIETPAAAISAFVDGTPGSNDMPTALVFRTTPDGSNLLAERMRLSSNERVGFGSTAPATKLHAVLSGTASATALRLGNDTDTGYAQLQFIGSTFATTSRQKMMELVTGDAASGITFRAGAGTAEHARFDLNGRLVHNSVTAKTVKLLTNDYTHNVQSVGLSTPGFLAVRYPGAVASTAASLYLARSRGATDGDMTIVAASDVLGYLSFGGSDGTSFQEAGRIIGRVDGTPSAGVMPGRIEIQPTPAASATPATTFRFDASGDAVSVAAAGAIGYTTGAGGAVTQLTSKSTGVTLNRPSGQITMNGAALAAATAVSFTLTNSVIATTDVVYACIDSGATAGAYSVTTDAVGAGSCQISVRNNTAGSLSEAIVLNFVVLRAATA